MARFPSLLAALLLTAGCSGPVAVDPTPFPSPVAGETTPAPTPVPVFETDRALEHVRVLSVDVGHRQAGSREDALAVEYMSGVLSGFGYEVELQAFPLPQGGESWNVVGRPPGFTTEGPYLLAGGHHDSLRGPGANDNATGVAVVLELARVVAANPAPLPLAIVLFGAEERQPVPGGANHVGSRHYVSQMDAQARGNLVALLNVDMVGRGDSLVFGRLRTGPREGTDRLARLASELGIPGEARVLPNWSDHGSFSVEGMNAGWIWAGEDPAFHSPGDTFDRVQAEPVGWSGRLGEAFVRSYE